LLPDIFRKFLEHALPKANFAFKRVWSDRCPSNDRLGPPEGQKACGELLSAFKWHSRRRPNPAFCPLEGSAGAPSSHSNQLTFCGRSSCSSIERCKLCPRPGPSPPPLSCHSEAERGICFLSASPRISMRLNHSRLSPICGQVFPQWVSPLNQRDFLFPPPCFDLCHVQAHCSRIGILRTTRAGSRDSAR